jgi:hypothetical protein
MQNDRIRFRLAVMLAAVFGGSALAGCCGGPFGASGDDDCGVDDVYFCKHSGDGGTPDAGADAQACATDASTD